MKTMNKLSAIKIIKNYIEVEGEESLFLPILNDSPVGGSSVGRHLSTLQMITKMMTDALIISGRPDTSCAHACYIGQ